MAGGATLPPPSSTTPVSQVQTGGPGVGGSRGDPKMGPVVGPGVGPEVGSGMDPGVGTGVDPGVGTGVDPGVGQGVGPVVGPGWVQRDPGVVQR